MLGVSIPWNEVFINKGHGARLRKQAKNYQKQTNILVPVPRADDLSSEKKQPKTVPNSSSSDWLDLLTGDVTHLNPFANPVNEQHDDLALSQSSSSTDMKPSDNATKQYINFLKSLTGPQMVCFYNLLMAITVLQHYSESILISSGLVLCQMCSCG